MSDENDRMDIDSRKYDGLRHQRTVTNPDHEEEDEEKKVKQRFEVKKWTAVAFWLWGMYQFSAIAQRLLTQISWWKRVPFAETT